LHGIQFGGGAVVNGIEHISFDERSSHRGRPVNRFLVFPLLLVAVVLLASCAVEQDWFDFFFTEGSSTVTLAWDPNTEPDLAGYILYYGQASTNYDFVIDTGTNASYTVGGLAEGETYYFAVTAYNAESLESDFSNEVEYTVPVGD
jgi:hypothetical protein